MNLVDLPSTISWINLTLNPGKNELILFLNDSKGLRCIIAENFSTKNDGIKSMEEVI